MVHDGGVPSDPTTLDEPAVEEAIASDMNGSTAAAVALPSHRGARRDSGRDVDVGRPASRRPANGRRKRRARRLFGFDRALGVRFVAGADEAGRGCLAGPLVSAAVLFDYARIGPREVRLLGLLDDSKQRPEAVRDELLPLILRAASQVAIVSRCAPGIDDRGLHVTNLAALRDALRAVARPGCLCLSDGFPLGDLGYEHRAVVGGDGKSAAIAAASVVAKVTRDRFMRRAAALHPEWEFESHVGYATPEHRAAIERHGVSPLHRRSFQSIAYQQLSL